LWRIVGETILQVNASGKVATGMGSIGVVLRRLAVAALLGLS